MVCMCIILFQMVHETTPSDALPITPALPTTPGLTNKRPRLNKLQKGMSIIDHDVDLEDDGNGIRKRSTHVEVP